MNNTQIIHNKETYNILFSELFERAAYYGLRATIVLVLIESLNLDSSKALEYYGLITGSVYLLKIVGGVLGDFVLSNKNAAIIGAAIQMAGTFVAAFPNLNMFITGMILFLLGNMLYSPNLTALFGKNYLNRKQYLDLAFILKYFFVNIGAFVGVLSVSLIMQYYGTSIALILAGSYCGIAMLFISVSKKIDETEISTYKNDSKNSVLIIITLLIGTISFFTYTFTAESLYTISKKIEDTIPKTSFISYSYISQNLNTYFIILASILTYFIWKKYSDNFFTKLTIASIIGGLGLLIMYFIYHDFTPPAYITALLLISILEVQFEALINAIYVKYLNPKFLATFIGATSLIYYLLNRSTFIYDHLQYDEPLLLGVIIYFVIGAVCIFLINFVKKQPLKSSDVLDDDLTD